MGRALGSKNTTRYSGTCLHCHTPFTASRKDARACSDICAIRLTTTGYGVRQPRINTQIYTELRRVGLTYAAIANAFGVSRQTVQQTVASHTRRLKNAAPGPSSRT